MREVRASLATVVGAGWSAFCPACVPAVAIFLSSIGLGVLTNVIVSRGAMLVFLGLALVTLHISALVHRRSMPFLIAMGAAMLAIFARNIFLSQTLVYVSSMALFAAAALDFWFRRNAGAAKCPLPSR